MFSQHENTNKKDNKFAYIIYCLSLAINFKTRKKPNYNMYKINKINKKQGKKMMKKKNKKICFNMNH